MTLPLMPPPQNSIAVTQTKSPGWPLARPRMSVLIPFYRDDPTPLIKAVSDQADMDVELILIDDGCPDAALNANVKAVIGELATPALLISSDTNLGRAAARNHLARHARADWYLFLDADMRIPEDFLIRWTHVLADTPLDAVFGGYEPCQPQSSEFQLHAAFAAASDAPDADTRNRQGAVAVCSSNLAIRRRLYDHVPFDEGYRGWGWEDVDWALSAEQAGRLGHANVQAGHDGLQGVDALIEKFDAAGVNFARLLARHPGYAQRPGAKLANLVRQTGLSSALRPVTKALARSAYLPLNVRVTALKLFRASAAARDLVKGVSHE